MTLTLTDAELLVLAHIRRAGGFLSDEDAVNAAIWNFAGFLGVDRAPEVFALAVPPECAAPPPRRRQRRAKGAA